MDICLFWPGKQLSTQAVWFSNDLIRWASVRSKQVHTFHYGNGQKLVIPSLYPGSQSTCPWVQAKAEDTSAWQPDPGEGAVGQGGCRDGCSNGWWVITSCYRLPETLPPLSLVHTSNLHLNASTVLWIYPYIKGPEFLSIACKQECQWESMITFSSCGIENCWAMKGLINSTFVFLTQVPSQYNFTYLSCVYLSQPQC